MMNRRALKPLLPLLVVVIAGFLAFLAITPAPAAVVPAHQKTSVPINPPEGGVRPAAIDTYDDHRMAMSFALAGTKAPGVTIKDAACVNKTYPRFFEDLAAVVGAAATGAEPRRR